MTQYVPIVIDVEQPPAGLYYSERKLWNECPQARAVLERLIRCREALTEARVA